MLTLEQMEENKTKFIDLLKSITIEGAKIEQLVKWLEESDFFFAPATAISHGNYDGGLCEHSLNVYTCLRKLVEEFDSHVEVHETKDDNGNIGFSEEVVLHYSEDTIKIVGLLHDLSKINYYEKYSKNIKNEESGKWESVEAYRIREAERRQTFGDASVNSFITISMFLPLSQEEISTIINFNCGMDNGYSNKDIYGILNKCKLVTLLHSADMISSFVDKK